MHPRNCRSQLTLKGKLAPMEHLVRFCGTYGYGFIFIAVLMDVLGAPPVAMPLLVIAGGLAAAGKMSFGLVVLVASMAAALGDILWYVLGRNGGSIVSRVLSRLSIRSKACLA